MLENWHSRTVIPSSGCPSWPRAEYADACLSLLESDRYRPTSRSWSWTCRSSAAVAVEVQPSSAIRLATEVAGTTQPTSSSQDHDTSETTTSTWRREPVVARGLLVLRVTHVTVVLVLGRFVVVFSRQPAIRRSTSWSLLLRPVRCWSTFRSTAPSPAACHSNAGSMA
jgi:hypothetical protein